jgi:hypothetical protein
MSHRVFIQANNKQLLGARLAKYALERHARACDAFRVEILNVDELEVFRNFAGATYLRSGREVRYEPGDLQSFTLSRFMPPEVCGYAGRGLVIDPDIFALADVSELLEWDLRDHAVACCRKNDGWDTSVMVLDCARLTHWKVGEFLGQLGRKELDYADLMTLRGERSVLELPRVWNSLDRLDANTKMLHTTDRLTQPWKTGLPIDFRRNPMAPVLGFIPREWLHKLLGRYPSRYQPHPDRHVEAFFFRLLREAIRDSAVDESFVRAEVSARHVRDDIFEALARASEAHVLPGPSGGRQPEGRRISS